MKNILYTFLLFFSLSNLSVAQSDLDINNLIPFVGNWEWQNGNQTFKVQIFVNDGYLKGHYELVETNGMLVTTIYKSNKLLNPDLNFYFGYAIFGGSHDGIKFGASIDDNVLYGDGFHSTKDGSLDFTIQNPTCNGCPITATWKITVLQGMKSTDEPENFTIPTDITLTKVN